MTALVLLCLQCWPAFSAEPPVGQWLSEKRTAAGMGKTLEFSSDGRLRLSQGVVIGYQWILEESRKKGDIVQIVDPATGERLRSLQLHFDDRAGQLIETDLATGEKFKMAFVSRGRQEGGASFLGRWQFMLAKFGIPAVYEYTEDGWMWIRAPIQADVGTYTMQGDKVIPQWPGEYPPLVEIVRQGRILLATTPEGAQERFLPPKLLETLIQRPANPRQ